MYNIYKPNQISLYMLTPISDGFDNGVFKDAPDLETYLDSFRTAGSRTLTQLIRKFSGSDSPVRCLLYDSILPWALDVATQMGIFAAAFFTNSASVSSIYLQIKLGVLTLPVRAEMVPLSLPGLPPLGFSEMPSFVARAGSPSPYLAAVLEQFSKSERNDCVFVNSFLELESKLGMDFGTQESRGPGLNKRMWSIDEDRKLIGALLDLQNEGKYKAESGFKPGLFNAVEKRLAETLPNSGLKADPHIKSRIKTLKAHFGVVHDMIYGSHISGFGFDDTKMCVVAEKEVWDTYLQSHKKAAYFRDKPFPLYKELCTIFGKDRAIGKDSETPADALEELNKENAQIGHDYEVNDGLDSMSFTQSATIGNTSGESSRKKRKVRSQSDENMIYEIMEKSTMIISSTMEATANRLSLALEDATVTDLKLQLNKELMKLQGLSMIERHKATIKIGCDRDLTQIFFTIDDEEKEAWVKVILS